MIRPAASLLSRRTALLAGLAAGLAGPAAALDTAKLGEPIGAAGLALRKFFVADFAGTLRVLKTMGYGQVELSSFPGVLGNFRGDYSPLEKMRPAEIRRAIADAGMVAPSWHFFGKEFEPAVWPATLDWARGVGAQTLIFSDGFTMPKQPTVDDVRRYADVLNTVGQRVRSAGMRMSIHSDAALWRNVGDRMMVDHLMALVPAGNCQIQLDFGSVVQAGADGAALIERFPDRINSLHLRDGKKPADPDAYMPALPLGEGDVDWVKVMRAARRAGIRQYIVEMQLRPAIGMLDGMKTSMDYLRRLQI